MDFHCVNVLSDRYGPVGALITAVGFRLQANVFGAYSRVVERSPMRAIWRNVIASLAELSVLTWFHVSCSP